jgi:polar amino acid transport system substrate-binding protein
MFIASTASTFRLGKAVALAALLLTLALPAATEVKADTLDRIKTAGKLVLGYRDDARPFAFKDEAGKPAGFSVALCERIAGDLKTALNLPNLAVEWAPVVVDDRTAALQQGRIDILCGADSVTLGRRQDVSFSIPIYPGGIGAVASINAPQALRDILEGKTAVGPVWRGAPARILNQRSFAVVTGTTAEAWLAERIKALQVDVKVVPVKQYAEGVESLLNGSADIFFGDRSIILDAAKAALADGSAVALDRLFTHAPIALAIARDNDALRLVVDRSLSHSFASPDFREIYVKWFGAADVGSLQFYESASLPE